MTASPPTFCKYHHHLNSSPQDFETGPLPWEERAATESSLPPVEPEEPILIPEVPEFLEAVDPLKESEVPDLEETGESLADMFLQEEYVRLYSQKHHRADYIYPYNLIKNGAVA